MEKATSIDNNSDSLATDLAKGFRLLKEGFVLFLLAIINNLAYPILDIVSHLDRVDISSETPLQVFAFKILFSFLIFLFGIPGVVEILIGIHKIDKSKNILRNNSKTFLNLITIGLLFSSIIGFSLAMIITSLELAIYSVDRYTNIYLDIIYLISAVFIVFFMFLIDRTLFKGFQPDAVKKRLFIPTIASSSIFIIWLALYFTKVGIFLSSNYTPYEFKLYLSEWLYPVTVVHVCFLIACTITVLFTTIRVFKYAKTKSIS